MPAVMEDCDITIVGGGVCGVLAGQRFAREGFTYRILEKASDYGGVWAYRANSYSHLQVKISFARQCKDMSSSMIAD